MRFGVFCDGSPSHNALGRSERMYNERRIIRCWNYILSFRVICSVDMLRNIIHLEIEVTEVA